MQFLRFLPLHLEQNLSAGSRVSDMLWCFFLRHVKSIVVTRRRCGAAVRPLALKRRRMERLHLPGYPGTAA